MQKEILSELEDLRDETEFILNNEEIIENKHVENYLRSLERIRYNIFNKIFCSVRIRHRKQPKPTSFMCVVCRDNFNVIYIT